MAHPPQTRDLHDWGYYNIYIDNLQSKIAKLREECPLDRTNKEEVMMQSHLNISDHKKLIILKEKAFHSYHMFPKIAKN